MFILANLVRDLPTPFFAELVVEDWRRSASYRGWCGWVLCKLRWTCLGQGVSGRRGKVKNASGEGCFMVKVRELRKVR